MARQDGTTRTAAGVVPHPAYQLWAETWQRLLDVYEGAGKFQEPSRPYLYAHPREWLDHSVKGADGKWVSNTAPVRPSPKLLARRKIARYENIAATLVDQLAAALFRKSATRTFQDPESIPKDHPLHEFWENADGLGRDIDCVMRDNWIGAAVFGHVVLYADRMGENGATKADQAPVIVRSYTPLDVVDWLTDDIGNLKAVRLLEAAEREGFETPAAAVVSQVRDVDDTSWSLTFVNKGLKPTKAQPAEGKASGQHGFGTLPVRALYARRRALTPTIGRSVLGDPALYIDLYNLTSEVRELLRNQTFAILNIPLGPEGSIEREMGLIGETTGTANVLFSSQKSDYVSPEGTNVQMYHEHIDRLVRTIYRLAVVTWESDSKDAESAESRKLKKADLHAMLSGYADECEQAEKALAEFVYRAAYGEQWQAQWDKDQPSISYPDDFDVTGLLDEIEAATQAIALELGETATKEVKKRAIPKILPNLPQPTTLKIHQEIDAQEVKTQAQQDAELMQMRFGQQMPPTGGNGDGGAPPV